MLRQIRKLRHTKIHRNWDRRTKNNNRRKYKERITFYDSTQLRLPSHSKNNINFSWLHQQTKRHPKISITSPPSSHSKSEW